MSTMSQIRWVRYQLDPLIAKGKRQHLGRQEQLELERLTSEQARLNEKLNREIRAAKDAEETRRD